MIEKITDHETEALDRNLTQFKKKPNFEALITIACTQVQEIEDIGYDMIEKRFLVNATGVTLNKYGEMVNEPRPFSGEASTDDDKYRTLIFSRIAANTSFGTRPDIYNILGIL